MRPKKPATSRNVPSTGQDRQPGREPPSPAADSRDHRPIHQEQGEGIGLSIVKRLCELLDASVEMESNPGTGTSFRIVFPRRYDAADAPRGGA